MTQYAGRIGRPFDYVQVTSVDVDLPDKTGALLLTVPGVIAVTMKNGSTVSMDLPVGLIPGDFRQVNTGTVPAVSTIFAVLVSI